MTDQTDPIGRAELDRIIQWTKGEARRLRHKPNAMGLAIHLASDRFNVNRTHLARSMSRRGAAVRKKRSKQRKVGAEMPKKPKPKKKVLDIQQTFNFEEKLNQSLGII